MKIKANIISVNGSFSNIPNKQHIKPMGVLEGYSIGWLRTQMRFLLSSVCRTASKCPKLKNIFIINKSLTKYLGIFYTSLGSPSYIFTVSYSSLVSHLSIRSKVKMIRKQMLMVEKKLFVYFTNFTLGVDFY